MGPNFPIATRPGGSIIAYGGNGVIAVGGSAPLRYADNAAVIFGTLGNVASPQVYIIAPFPYRLRNLYTLVSATPGAGITIGVTMRVNDVNTPVTHNIADPATTGQDAVNVSAPGVAGDRISIGLTRVVGTPAGIIYICQCEIERL